jgi:protein-L-isoaspartate(D-aspartate) O-methyltransferase
MNSGFRGIGMTSQRTRGRLIERLREQGICNEQVLQAMLTTPRHMFLDEALASRAYEDTALPIGHGQTISQPYTVARMSEVLFANGARKVLEIGTGSGYQTAILSMLAAEVYSIERIEPLLKQARRRLQSLAVRNVRLKLYDGGLGWTEKAPFDGIIVTAAAAEIPQALLTQLSMGGRLVIPVGDAVQELLLITHTETEFVTERLELVNFVPLIRDKN